MGRYDEGEDGHSIAVDPLGSVYITGVFGGTVDFDPGPETFNLSSAGGTDGFLLKLDAAGNFVWAGRLGGQGWNEPNAVFVDDAANIYSTGFFSLTASVSPWGLYSLTSEGGWDAFVYKLSQPCLLNTSIAGAAVLCPGDSTALSVDPGYSYIWSTGDTMASIIVSPVTTTSYTVTVNDGPDCSITESIEVQVNNTPTTQVAATPSTICVGESVSLTAAGGVTYSWSSGDTTAMITTTPAQTTSYTVTVTDVNGCSATDTATVVVSEVLIAIDGTTEICTGDMVWLEASGGISYQWSTGNTSSVLEVTLFEDEQLVVTVEDMYGCTAQQDVAVTVHPLPEVNLGADLDHCPGDTIILSAENGTSYQWSTGQVSDEIRVTPAATTHYAITLTDANGCSSSDSLWVRIDQELCPPCIVTFPNAFTPDGDGINDTFAPLSVTEIELLDFRIYNRWGELIHDNVLPWDGLHNGEPLPPEVYLYVAQIRIFGCRGDGEQVVRGEVTLLR